MNETASNLCVFMFSLLSIKPVSISMLPMSTWASRLTVPSGPGELKSRLGCRSRSSPGRGLRPGPPTPQPNPMRPTPAGRIGSRRSRRPPATVERNLTAVPRKVGQIELQICRRRAGTNHSSSANVVRRIDAIETLGVPPYSNACDETVSRDHDHADHDQPPSSADEASDQKPDAENRHGQRQVVPGLGLDRQSRAGCRGPRGPRGRGA